MGGKSNACKREIKWSRELARMLSMLVNTLEIGGLLRLLATQHGPLDLLSSTCVLYSPCPGSGHEG